MSSDAERMAHLAAMLMAGRHDLEPADAVVLAREVMARAETEALNKARLAEELEAEAEKLGWQRPTS